jgi:hypothetical protein
MEWNLARHRVLRIDVYWFRRRPRRRWPEHQLSRRAQEIDRWEHERTIREIEEMRRRRVADREAEA